MKPLKTLYICTVCLGVVRFGRRVLTSCWEAVLDVLSVLTSGRSCCGISSSLAAAVMFNAREESRRVRQAICTSLAGLQKAARLSNVLGTISHMLCCESGNLWKYISTFPEISGEFKKCPTSTLYSPAVTI